MLSSLLQLISSLLFCGQLRLPDRVLAYDWYAVPLDVSTNCNRKDVEMMTGRNTDMQ